MSAPSIKPAPVQKTLLVQADTERAFRVFTSRMGSWWPKSHSIGSAAMNAVIIEPRCGGRWYERGEDGSECEWGKVLEWEPPARVLLAWQLDGNWKYNPSCMSEVEIRFTAMGPHQTRVDLEHRHLERLGANAAAVRELLNS